MLLAMGPDRLSEAALQLGVVYDTEPEMLQSWQEVLLPQAPQASWQLNAKDMSYSLRRLFRKVKVEWMRELYVQMGHSQSEAQSPDRDKLIADIVGYIQEVRI